MKKPTHTIKLKEGFCDAVLEGRKTFEIRYNDRGYQTGDLVRFSPVDSADRIVQHRIADKLYEITYVLSGWGIPDDYVVFAIKEWNESV